MKKNIYKQSFASFSYLLIISVILIFSFSCNRTKPFFEESVEFANSNWDFENRMVTFEKQIEGSDIPYQVFVDLDLEHDLEMEQFPLTLSIYSDQGEETHKQLFFFFPVVADNGMTSPNTPKILTKEVYSEKYFNNSAKYTFKILRKSSKYDLFGIKAVKLRIVPKKIKS